MLGLRVRLGADRIPDEPAAAIPLPSGPTCSWEQPATATVCRAAASRLGDDQGQVLVWYGTIPAMAISSTHRGNARGAL